MEAFAGTTSNIPIGAIEAFEYRTSVVMLTVPQDLALLSVDEAAAVCRRVFDWRPCWRRLSPASSGYVLGSPSYLGLEARAYRERASATNPAIRAGFGDLYARLWAAIEPSLRALRDAPLCIDNGHALPGFQIVLVEESTVDPRGTIGAPHWDWNFLYLDWDPPLAEEMDPSFFASFTLPLGLPASGSGLNVWPTLSSAEVDEYAAEHGLSEWDAVEALTRPVPPSYHAYSPGTLVVHSGQIVHGVAPWDFAAGDARVTMQGHALFHHGRWQVYW